ncbi:MAG: hypothetical protein DRN78_01330 [Thermoproteota archaeon]|nr:MAG: hypothetical protein DRN78_01330 [Candidatus Korarchaeota archaeon]
MDEILCALVELPEEKAVLKYEEWEKRQYVLREGYHIANHNHRKLATTTPHEWQLGESEWTRSDAPILRVNSI